MPGARRRSGIAAVVDKGFRPFLASLAQPYGDASNPGGVATTGALRPAIRRRRTRMDRVRASIWLSTVASVLVGALLLMPGRPPAVAAPPSSQPADDGQWTMPGKNVQL